jgi:hypothetical protein
MSSEGDQDTVQPAVPAPISADGFAGVRDLISLVVTVKTLPADEPRGSTEPRAAPCRLVAAACSNSKEQ